MDSALSTSRLKSKDGSGKGLSVEVELGRELTNVVAALAWYGRQINRGVKRWMTGEAPDGPYKTGNSRVVQYGEQEPVPVTGTGKVWEWSGPRPGGGRVGGGFDIMSLALRERRCYCTKYTAQV